MKNVEECVDLIDRLFCRDEAQFGGYTLVGTPEIVVPERLVRATLNRRTDTPHGHDAYQLTIFLQITGLAGELWEHTARNLLRVGALNHPALPQIAMGKFVPTEDIAFTLTRERGKPINIDHTVEWALRVPRRALEHFSTLLDALNELHSAGIIHRNLTAASLNTHVIDIDNADEVEIVLSRFEMSTLMGNVIRTVGAGSSPDTVAEARQFYTAPSGIEAERHLAFLAPELHSYLFDEHTSVRRDWVSTDVYGLGATAWEWFCGPIPDVLPEPYAEVQQAGPADRKAAFEAAAKEIGGSLEAEVTLHCTGELLDFVKSVEGELAAVFIVSSVKIAEGTGGSFSGEVEGLSVTVAPAAGQKCERCWTYAETVGIDPKHPTLCARCAGIIGG